MAEREARVGDNVQVVSGPHEGRGGTIAMLQEVQLPWKDPEWYALMDFQYTDCFGDVHKDQISVPVRRLKPR
jgi:KOW motif